MEKFWRHREHKAARARDEIQAFWARRGPATQAGDPSSSLVGCAASSAVDSYEGSPVLVDDWSVEREYLKFMATRPSDKELLEWVLRSEVWDFVP